MQNALGASEIKSYNRIQEVRGENDLLGLAIAISGKSVALLTMAYFSSALSSCLLLATTSGPFLF